MDASLRVAIFSWPRISRRPAVFVCAVSAFIGGCVETVRLDDRAALRPHLTRHFQAPRDACFNATRGALDELEIAIEREDRALGQIETRRVSYVATAYRPGSPGSTRTGADGTTTRVSGTPGTTIQQQQQYKYYIVVTGDAGQCTVEVARFRAWAEGRELDEVVVTYARDHIWKPFFREVEEHLPRTL
jgi:hypothetical protein